MTDRNQENGEATGVGRTVGRVRERSGPERRPDPLVVLADPTALAREAAEQCAKIAEEAVVRSGRFTVVLSGGSSPKLLYSVLAAEPYRTRLPWRRTTVFWGDERPVPPTHPDSNVGMARATLLDRVPIPPDRVHSMKAEREDLDAAAHEYQAEIAGTFEVSPSGAPPAFDLILLGLGADGHTASLFPHTEAVRETMRWVLRNHVPKLRTDRLTLTAPILNRGAIVLFLVTGADKAAALQGVLEGPADPERLPAQLIRPVAGRLVWLVDRPAASRLESRLG